MPSDFAKHVALLNRDIFDPMPGAIELGIGDRLGTDIDRRHMPALGSSKEGNDSRAAADIEHVFSLVDQIGKSMFAVERFVNAWQDAKFSSIEGDAGQQTVEAGTVGIIKAEEQFIEEHKIVLLRKVSGSASAAAYDCELGVTGVSTRGGAGGADPVMAST